MVRLSQQSGPNLLEIHFLITGARESSQSKSMTAHDTQEFDVQIFYIGVKQLLSDRASDARVNTTAIVLDDIIVAINHGKVLNHESVTETVSFEYFGE